MRKSLIAALHHALVCSGIPLPLPNTDFKAASKTYEDIFKRKKCWSWPGLVFDSFYGRIFSIRMLLFLGFPPSLTFYAVLGVWLVRAGVVKRKKVGKQTHISFGFSKEELSAGITSIPNSRPTNSLGCYRNMYIFWAWNVSSLQIQVSSERGKEDSNVSTEELFLILSS